MKRTITPPPFAAPAVHVPAPRTPRLVEVDERGLATWATTLPLRAADERATIPAA